MCLQFLLKFSPEWELEWESPWFLDQLLISDSIAHRTWFAFADDPNGWATSKFVKLCYWTNTTLRFIEYLIGWEFLYFDDIILLSSDFYFLLRFANTIVLVCILAFVKAGAKTLLRIKLELIEQILYFVKLLEEFYSEVILIVYSTFCLINYFFLFPNYVVFRV